jgi:hypothetical protein
MQTYDVEDRELDQLAAGSSLVLLARIPVIILSLL